MFEAIRPRFQYNNLARKENLYCNKIWLNFLITFNLFYKFILGYEINSSFTTEPQQPNIIKLKIHAATIKPNIDRVRIKKLNYMIYLTTFLCEL
jgi:hypothetical protein